MIPLVDFLCGSVLMVSCWMSIICPSLCILFADDNFSKDQWISTKLGMCIDIVEIWFQIAYEQFSSISVTVICPPYILIFAYRRKFEYQYQWIFTKLGMCIDIMEIWFGIANGANFVNL